MTRKLLFTVLFLVESASGRVLPDWLQGRSDLLPDVPDSAIEALRESIPHAELSDGHDFLHQEPMSKDYLNAVKTIASLGHDASLAMIWLYIEDPPAALLRNARTHQDKGALLSYLLPDVDAAKWLVPIVRLRLEWAALRIKDESIEETSFSGAELGGIEGILMIHGTDDDLRRVLLIEEQFRASRWANTLYPLDGTTAEQRWENAMWRRKDTLQRAMPLCDRFRQMISMPLLGFESGSEQTTQLDTRTGNSFDNEAGLPETAPNTLDRVTEPHALLWFGAALSTGLVCWFLFFKRRSP